MIIFIIRTGTLNFRQPSLYWWAPRILSNPLKTSMKHPTTAPNSRYSPEETSKLDVGDIFNTRGGCFEYQYETTSMIRLY